MYAQNKILIKMYMYQKTKNMYIKQELDQSVHVSLFLKRYFLFKY